MSTKDLIDRLTQTNASGRNSRSGTSTGTTDPGKVKSTRVGARVIRRRRVAKPKEEPPKLQTLGGADTTQLKKPAADAVQPPVDATTATEVAAPTPEPSAEEVAAKNTDAETPPTKVETQASTKSDATPTSDATDETTESSPNDSSATSAQDVAADAAPAEAAETSAPASDEAESTPQAVAATATAGSETTAETPQEVTGSEESAESATPGSSQKTDESKATADAKHQKAKAEDPAPAIAASEDAADQTTAASKLAKTLPRAGNTGKGDFFPGLGSAVVRPPPGYDPNDPSGNRKRAQAAAEAAKLPKASENKVWRDEKPGTNEKRNTRRSHDDEQDEMGRTKRRRPARRSRIQTFREDFTRRRRRTKGRGGAKKVSPQAKAIKRRVEVDGEITVANLAHEMSIKSAQIIKFLMGMDMAVTVNDTIDFDTAQLVANEFEYEVINASFQEEEHLIDIAEDEGDQTSRVQWSPSWVTLTVKPHCWTPSLRPMWPPVKPGGSRNIPPRTRWKRRTGHPFGDTPVTLHSLKCAHAGLKSRTSWFWWWLPTTESCPKPSRR